MRKGLKKTLTPGSLTPAEETASLEVHGWTFYDSIKFREGLFLIFGVQGLT
jgi:hypothetical protein